MSAGVSSSHPTFPPWGAPSLSWVFQTSACKKSPCKKLLPSRHRPFGSRGELHQTVWLSPPTQVSLAGGLTLLPMSLGSACSPVLAALVPEGCRDGASPHHGSHHHGTQHPLSPGNVPSQEQTGPADSRSKAGTWDVTEAPGLPQAACLRLHPTSYQDFIGTNCL